MDAGRCEQLIEAYGAAPQRWPMAEREAALAFLASSPNAADLLKAARALDGLLDAWTLEPAALTLKAKVAAAADAQPASRGVLASPTSRRLWLRGAGLAAACAAGVIAGINVGRVGPAVRDADSEALSGVFGGMTILGARVDSEANS